ncbi:hypothetical protein [Paenibacillus senegalensis]|uniref:hypothetical protein n=1 Tax=Paenibacillus senegalensis TaxID=1465766 RepID=UPI0002887B29|nr:hypothetical protein [Paenibacillus senegalensis]
MHKTVHSTLLVLITGTILLTASGCYPQLGDNRSPTNYGSTRNDLSSSEQPLRQSAELSAQSSISHHNQSLTFKQDVSRQVEALNGVNSAIVMETDRNIYCAIMVDGTAAGTIGGEARQETNNSGTSLGRYNPFTFSQYSNPNDLATGINNYETVENPDHLAYPFVKTIADTIHQLIPGDKPVFVAANRNFINQLNMYAQESWAGRPLDPYVQQFNESAQQLFQNSAQPVQ